MSYSIFDTEDFNHDVKKLHKKYPSLKADLAKLGASLKKAPLQGVPIGRNCYKLRLAITSKGKSGGASVITNIQVAGQVVYLLSIYDKSEQDNIGEKAITAMVDTLAVCPTVLSARFLFGNNPTTKYPYSSALQLWYHTINSVQGIIIAAPR